MSHSCPYIVDWLSRKKVVNRWKTSVLFLAKHAPRTEQNGDLWNFHGLIDREWAEISEITNQIIFRMSRKLFNQRETKNELNKSNGNCWRRIHDGKLAIFITFSHRQRKKVNKMKLASWNDELRCESTVEASVTWSWNFDYPWSDTKSFVIIGASLGVM